MRAEFRRVPIDLIVVGVVALSILPLVAAGVGGPLRYLLALALIFLLPGYAIVATLFPLDGELDWVRRVALGVGLSIASVALLGVLLDLTPWGLSVPSIVASLLLLTLGASAVAWWRRLQVPEAERLSLSVPLALPRWRDLQLVDRLLAVAVAVALISGVAVMAVGLSRPPAPDRFTEFYLLDPAGGLVNYTMSLTTTTPGVVIVGIHNLEGTSINYTVIVLLVTLETVYNATTGTNQTVEGNSTFFDSFGVQVASGAASQRTYNFTIPVAGDYLLQFRLYIGTPQGNPYRFVDLRVHVA